MWTFSVKWENIDVAISSFQDMFEYQLVDFRGLQSVKAACDRWMNRSADAEPARYPDLPSVAAWLSHI